MMMSCCADQMRPGPLRGPHWAAAAQQRTPLPQPSQWPPQLPRTPQAPGEYKKLVPWLLGDQPMDSEDETAGSSSSGAQLDTAATTTAAATAAARAGRQRSTSWTARKLVARARARHARRRAGAGQWPVTRARAQRCLGHDGEPGKHLGSSARACQRRCSPLHPTAVPHTQAN